MSKVMSGVSLESFKYRAESDTYRTRYDPDTTGASMAVVATLANVLETAPTNLIPLQTIIDTDSLDSLALCRDGANGNINVTFTHEGCRITVSSDGTVVIDTPEDTKTRRI